VSKSIKEAEPGRESLGAVMKKSKLRDAGHGADKKRAGWEK